MGALDITELVITIILTFFFKIVPEKWMIMSIDLIVGMAVRLIFYFV